MEGWTNRSLRQWLQSHIIAKSLADGFWPRFGSGWWGRFGWIWFFSAPGDQTSCHASHLCILALLVEGHLCSLFLRALTGHQRFYFAKDGFVNEWSFQQRSMCLVRAHLAYAVWSELLSWCCRQGDLNLLTLEYNGNVMKCWIRERCPFGSCARSLTCATSQICMIRGFRCMAAWRAWKC